MSTELTVIEPAPLVAPTGAGIDFSNPLFQLLPGTLVINQANTQDENAIKGQFRVTNTGDQFKELTVALLMTPEQARSYYIGEPGQLNRTADNLMCFSRDMVRPDNKAKAPQSPTCATCPHGSWDDYRLFKEKNPNQPVPKNLIPKCDPYYYVVFVDTEFQMPMQMYIRGSNRKPFEQAMQNLARAFAKYKAATKSEPNIYDFSFKLQTQLVKNEAAKTSNYVLQIPGTSFKFVTPEERAEFGNLYAQFASKGEKQTAEAQTAKAVDKKQVDIDAAVSEGIAGNDDTITI